MKFDSRQQNRMIVRRQRWSPSVFLVTIMILMCLAGSVNGETKDEEQAATSSSGKTSASGDNKEPYKPMALQDSMKKSLNQDAQAARERYWQKTLEEIRSLRSPRQTKTDRAVNVNLNRWKLFTSTAQSTSSSSQMLAPHTAMPRGDNENDSSNEDNDQLQQQQPLLQQEPPPPEPERYNGYFSWERLLQEWSDDIQEYFDKIEAEGKGQYPMATFGRSKEGEGDDNDTPGTIDVTAVEDNDDSVGATTYTSIASATADSKADEPANNNIFQKVPRPIPAPRKEGEAVLPHTDISDKSKRVWIVTTAALPWMTGTAVNPLLRAAYMTTGRKEAGGSVTLMLPWLERKDDQDTVYGAGKSFATQEDQEAHIRGWLKNSANMQQASEELNIRWYTAWQNKVENSVYSMGDIVAGISEDEVDIMVLEEPEHLNWYRAPGESWTKKFKHVVGILHTNYYSYALDQPGALVRAPAMKLLCTWMCRSHCHRLIKLSGTMGQYAPEKELIENVHGVRGTFVDIGKELRETLLVPEKAAADPVFSPTAEPAVYFIGKMLWSKGIGSLMELLKYAEETANIKLHVDMYGGGPDKDAAEAKAEQMDVDMSFLGPVDHAELGSSHKVFINPSTSEVLCTTVAEALAMGKFVVLPSHPSNDFFTQFPNCLSYTSKEEFLGNLYYALTHSPEPMSEEYSYALTWQAATERFEAAGCIPVEEAELYKRWVESGNAGVEITLPPLIEDEEGRKVAASRLEKSRANFRKFRNTLSQEISLSRVLPKGLRDVILKELDRRLDLDIDELLNSPKLEVKLSPAELDKQCLDLFESVTKGPGGDLLRLIGGGSDVALQHRYMRREARKQLKAANALNFTAPLFLDSSFENTDENSRTASQWVSWAMGRNLPRNGTLQYYRRLPPKPAEGSMSTGSSKATQQSKEKENNLRMSLSHGTFMRKQHSSAYERSSWTGIAVPPPSRLITNARRLSSSRCGKGLSLLI